MVCDVGRQIRYFRIVKGLSGEKLAELCGLSPKGLNNIELGKSEPKFSTVERIVTALDITFDELMNEDHALIIDLN